VVLNINSKQSNSEDSAYRRLHPSLEPNVSALFDSHDRARLDVLPEQTLTQRLDSGVAKVWKLYRFRTDIREAIFGYDDLATWLKNSLERVTGSQALQAAEHRPTADRFLGTYDLEPLTPDNIDFLYLRQLAELLKTQHIPAIAFLTPTNHRLLHEYIDTPTYSKKLHDLSAPLRNDGITVLDLDAAFPQNQFIDNDHLTILGNQRLANTLGRAMRRVLAP
ncbi:MAG: hypothetical protein M3N19_05430, partial [Candidatus Eremiobacteraeota bacterium]|nr:hypothetical protein [Candidatus Eremiobacteraeota bacterium]